MQIDIVEFCKEKKTTNKQQMNSNNPRMKAKPGQ
jgi:hypothetical protein